MAQILFIDPDLTALHTHLSQAKSLGHEPIGATAGMRAVEELSRNPEIRMVVSELDLPDGTFEELFLSIRHSPYYNQLPFLVLSTQVKSTRLIRLISSGVEYAAKKPISEDEMRFLLGRGLKCAADRAKHIRDLERRQAG